MTQNALIKTLYNTAFVLDDEQEDTSSLSARDECLVYSKTQDFKARFQQSTGIFFVQASKDEMRSFFSQVNKKMIKESKSPLPDYQEAWCAVVYESSLIANSQPQKCAIFCTEDNKSYLANFEEMVIECMKKLFKEKIIYISESFNQVEMSMLPGISVNAQELGDFLFENAYWFKKDINFEKTHQDTFNLLNSCIRAQKDSIIKNYKMLQDSCAKPSLTPEGANSDVVKNKNLKI